MPESVNVFEMNVFSVSDSLEVKRGRIEVLVDAGMRLVICQSVTSGLVVNL